MGPDSSTATIYLEKTDDGSGAVYGNGFTTHNPDFETGELAPWTVAGTASIVGSSVVIDPWTVRAPDSLVYKGKHAAAVSGKGSCIEQKIEGLRENTFYSLRCYGRVAEQGDEACLGVKEYGGEEKSKVITETGYTEAEIFFKTAPGRTSAVVYFLKLGGNGDAYCDEFFMVQSMFPGSRFGAPFFVEYGKDYKVSDGQGGWKLPPHGAEKYVYAISNDGFWNNGSSMILARVKRDKIGGLNPEDWQFHKGGDGMDDANWSHDMDTAAPLLVNPDKVGMTAVQYIQPLDKYVMVQWYYPRWYEYDFAQTVWEFYEASAPWGPWEKFHSRVFDPEGYYNPAICSKFINADGLNMTITTAGYFYCGELYKFTTIPLTLTTGHEMSGMLSNSGFEDGDMSSWQVKGQAAIANSPARSGSFAVEIAAGSMICQDVTGLKPNTAYFATGWVKPGAPGSEAMIGVKNFGGREQFKVITGTGYTRGSILFITGPEHDSACIYLKASGTGAVYGDDFEIGEVIMNPDFEGRNLDGWKVDGKASIETGLSNIHSGSSAVRISERNSCISQTISGLQPGTMYRITGWGKVAAAGEEVRIGVKDFGGPEIYHSITNSEYTEASMVFKTGPADTGATIYLGKTSGEGDAFGDDFTFGAVLKNSDFEAGLRCWNYGSGVSWYPASPYDRHTLPILIKENVHSGKYAIVIKALNKTVMQKVTGLRPNTTYVLSGWGRVSSEDGQVVIGVKNYSIGCGYVESAISSAGYSCGTVEFTTGLSDTEAVVYFYKAAGTGDVYVDEFCLYESQK